MKRSAFEIKLCCRHAPAGGPGKMHPSKKFACVLPYHLQQNCELGDLHNKIERLYNQVLLLHDVCSSYLLPVLESCRMTGAMCACHIKLILPCLIDAQTVNA